MAPSGVFSAAQLIVAVQVRLRPEFKEMWALIKGLTESGETLPLVSLLGWMNQKVVGLLVSPMNLLDCAISIIAIYEDVTDNVFASSMIGSYHPGAM